MEKRTYVTAEEQGINKLLKEEKRMEKKENCKEKMEKVLNVVKAVVEVVNEVCGGVNTILDTVTNAQNLKKDKINDSNNEGGC